MNINKLHKWLGSAALLFLLILPGCHETEVFVEEETKIDVETACPSVRTIALSGDFIGTVEAGEKVSVIPRVSGRIAQKNFKVGDSVKAGDILFTIDDTDLQMEKKKAQEEVSKASADLANENAKNEAVKYAANEALFTMDTKSMENYNELQKAIREEYEERLKLYKASENESIHREEGDRIEEFMDRDDEKAATAEEFGNHLSSMKEAYDAIMDSDDPVKTAKSYGLSKDKIGDKTAAKDIAEIYVKVMTPYDTIDEIKSAISTCNEEVKSALSDKESQKTAYNNNILTVLSDEVDVQLARGTIANAEEAAALKRKLMLDYEIYTKAKNFAETQSKLVEGDTAVINSDIELQKARRELQQVDMKLGYTRVTSPINGIVTEVKIEDYGLASDQSAAYVISDPDTKKAVFYVSGEAKNNMTVGQTVRIDKNGTVYNAEVDTVSDSPDEKKQLYKVSAFITDNDRDVFDAGSVIHLTTDIRKEDNAITVPIGVVYYDEGRAFVYVARDGKAVKTGIETGISDGTDIQVLSGLTAEDPVIVSWSSQLEDQADINIMGTKEPVVVTVEDPDPVGEGEAEAANAAKTDAGKPVSEEESPKEDVGEEIPVRVETTARVNVRKEPGTDRKILDTVPEGTSFDMLGEENGWTRISYNGQEAFIKSDYVRTQGQ